MSEDHPELIRAAKVETYLMGGENREFEIGEFPRLGKRAIFEKSRAAYIIDVASPVPFESRSAD